MRGVRARLPRSVRREDFAEPVLQIPRYRHDDIMDLGLIFIWHLPLAVVDVECHPNFHAEFLDAHEFNRPCISAIILSRRVFAETWKLHFERN